MLSYEIARDNERMKQYTERKPSGAAASQITAGTPTYKGRPIDQLSSEEYAEYMSAGF